MLRWSSALLLPLGGERGGGEEACGIPGGGEEDEDRGREVQGGVDEAQHRQEEEGGGSVSGRDPQARAWQATATVTAGDRKTAQQMTPRRISEGGGVLLPPAVDRHRPMDGT